MFFQTAQGLRKAGLILKVKWTRKTVHSLQPLSHVTHSVVLKDSCPSSETGNPLPIQVPIHTWASKSLSSSHFLFLQLFPKQNQLTLANCRRMKAVKNINSRMCKNQAYATDLQTLLTTQFTCSDFLLIHHNFIMPLIFAVPFTGS
jgi:hypothetical protein